MAGPASPATTPDDESSSVEKRPERFDVLVVEDDEGIREALAERFRDEGYRVATAADGSAALEVLRRAQVGVLVLDLMLPVVSGYEVLRAVNDPSDGARRTPTIVITAFSNAKRPPATPVFLKPLNIESLLRAVRAYLGRSHLRG